MGDFCWDTLQRGFFAIYFSRSWEYLEIRWRFFFFTKTFVFNGFIRCGFRGEVPIRQMCKIRCFRLIPQTINRNALFLQLNCIIFFFVFSPQIYHSFWEQMTEKFMNFLLLLHYWWKVLKIWLIKSNYASLFFYSNSNTFYLFFYNQRLLLCSTRIFLKSLKTCHSSFLPKKVKSCWAENVERFLIFCWKTRIMGGNLGSDRS